MNNEPIDNQPVNSGGTGARSAAAESAAAQSAAAQARRKHAALRYTTLRLAIFLAALGLLSLVRVRGLLLVALALAISGLASYVLLRPQREAMSWQLAEASSRRRERAQARAAREDSIADALREPDDQTPADAEKERSDAASATVGRGQYARYEQHAQYEQPAQYDQHD